MKERLSAYLALIRLDRPIGTLLLLWPALAALWLAAEGVPDLHLLVIFILGTLLMRSAGCAINDYADRKLDGGVKRTAQRPLATGRVTAREALLVALVLALLAFGLVLLTNRLTVYWSLGAVVVAALYPFMKRYTHLPQVVLGVAFSWSVPMAFAAQRGEVIADSWLLFVAVVLWTVVYDTFYAMVDRDDDLRLGIKSTAVLFGEDDRLITGLLQACVILVLALLGPRFELGYPYYLGLIAMTALFARQQWLIRHRGREDCFRAFLNNNWAGMAMFLGIFTDYLLR
ncbi:MAG TPA: 4-hydroxybenzoate octaprenyltransferase [Spongiibacteraceae bacterium]|nr:4-hydroxybenzoate octaprenyltransferase [Spongiibacteraceae bacterium]HUH38831.1 4-hydroxybenzoate octaprenyltransferase [Spongiibacteraceae bacterium]